MLAELKLHRVKRMRPVVVQMKPVVVIKAQMEVGSPSPRKVLSKLTMQTMQKTQRAVRILETVVQMDRAHRTKDLKRLELIGRRGLTKTQTKLVALQKMVVNL